MVSDRSRWLQVLNDTSFFLFNNVSKSHSHLEESNDKNVKKLEAPLRDGPSYSAKVS